MKTVVIFACKWLSIGGLGALAIMFGLTALPGMFMAVMSSDSGKPAMIAFGLLYLVVPAVLCNMALGAIFLLSQVPRLYIVSGPLLLAFWIAVAVKIYFDGLFPIASKVVEAVLGIPSWIGALLHASAGKTF